MAAAIPYVLAGLQAAGGMARAKGTWEQGKANANALAHSSETNRRNAQLLTDEWLFNEENALAIARDKQGSTKAHISSAGLDGSLSAAMAMMQTVDSTERDVISLRLKYISGIENYKRQAELDLEAVGTTLELAKLGVASDLLTGVTNAASSFYNARNK